MRGDFLNFHPLKYFSIFFINSPNATNTIPNFLVTYFLYFPVANKHEEKISNYDTGSDDEKNNW